MLSASHWRKVVVSRIFSSYRVDVEKLNASPVSCSLYLSALLVSAYLAVRLTRSPVPSDGPLLICQSVRLPFRLPVCQSRSLSLSFTDFLKNSHSYFFYLVSITLVRQPTLKKPFDFDHASVSAPLGTLIQRAFLSPLTCTVVTLSSLTAVLPSSFSKKQ